MWLSEYWHTNKIRFPLQSKYKSNDPYPQDCEVNRGEGRRGEGNKYLINISKEAVDHHNGLTVLMISDYVESLTRNWNLDFWILMFFFWETDRPRAVTVSCEVHHASKLKKQWRKNCRLWGWGAPKVLFVTTLNHSALHWTLGPATIAWYD